MLQGKLCRKYQSQTTTLWSIMYEFSNQRSQLN